MREPEEKPRTATEVLEQFAAVAATDLVHLALGARLERLLHARVESHFGSARPASRTPPDGGHRGENAEVARASADPDGEALDDAERAAVAYANALLQPGDPSTAVDVHGDLASHFDESAVRDITAFVLRAEMQHRLTVARRVGVNPEPSNLGMAGHHAAMEPDQDHAIGSIVCPRCGHELSMFMEIPESPANRAAQRLADALASWRYVAFLSLAIVVYIAVALAVNPFGMDTHIVLNYLGIGMTTLVGIQTPLILLTQRRDAERDRERDQEVLRVATHTEHDLHALRNALDERRD